MKNGVVVEGFTFGFFVGLWVDPIDGTFGKTDKVADSNRGLVGIEFDSDVAHRSNNNG